MSQGVAIRRRKIDAETKVAAVLEGLKGESSVADICRKYQISESLYYRWRDKFLEGGSRALASRHGSGPEIGVKAKISELERIIGRQAEIKRLHPFWGYRRVRAWLKYREYLPVGYRRVYRLMKANELLVPQTRYRAKRQPSGRKPRANRQKLPAWTGENWQIGGTLRRVKPQVRKWPREKPHERQ
jgi:transposase-like protein